MEPFLWSIGFSGLRFPKRHCCSSESLIFESRLGNQNIKIDRPASRKKKKKNALATSQSVFSQSALRIPIANRLSWNNY